MNPESKKVWEKYFKMRILENDKNDEEL